MDIQNNIDSKYQQYIRNLESILEESIKQFEVNWNPINFDSLQKKYVNQVYVH
jgi:hypothetical protein